MPGAVRGYGGKAKAISPDAIGPSRFLGARLIEANRHQPRAFLSGAALFIDPT
jgi:predicted fused transcriptional regulator/phosphomethylpyrimidine kinase